MTLQQLIDRALSELKVIDSTESGNAADTATMVGLLNRMMAAWEQADKDFNWQAQTDETLTAYLPDWALDGVISSLAVFAAPEFDSPISIELMNKYTEGKQMIERTLINLNLEGADMSHLHPGAYRWDIDTDT